MLTILAFLNKNEIGRVYVHNLGITNSKGEYKYEAWIEEEDGFYKIYDISFVPKKTIVWHKREDGWMKLTEKVLRRLRK